MAQRKSNQHQHNNNSWFLDALGAFTLRIFKKVISNLSFTSFKNLYKSKYEKWVFICSIPATIYYIVYQLDKRTNVSVWGYILAPGAYFIYKSIYQVIKEDYYKYRYKSFYDMFNKKVSVVAVNTDRKNSETTYTIHSYISKSKIDKEILEIEHYFNTSITGIIQDKKNMKVLYIKTNKYLSYDLDKISSKKKETKLIAILKYYNFAPTLLKIEENEFLTTIRIRCRADIKKVLTKSDDIASKLKLPKEDLAIKVELDTFVFEIKNQKEKIYYFEDYIDQVTIPKDNNFPVLLGINQNTGKLIIDNLNKLLYIQISGTPGSGKSVFFNSLIQSSMYFNTNTIYILVDFKVVEFQSYETFKNSIFITEHDIFNDLLTNLVDEMENRWTHLAKIKVKNIKSYNLHSKKKMPYIALFVDEIADIMNCDGKLAQTINKKLKRLLGKGRAAGIRVIFATQRPSHNQFDTDVRGIMDTKIGFKVADSDEARLVGIKNIEKHKTGEFTIKTSSERKIKALFIDEDQNKNKVYEYLENKIGVNNNVSNFKKEV